MKTCTISRDLRQYDLLIEDLISAYGKDWGDLSFTDATQILKTPAGKDIEQFILILEPVDELDLGRVIDFTALCLTLDKPLIIVTAGLSQAGLKKLDESQPYPVAKYPLQIGSLPGLFERARAIIDSHLPDGQLKNLFSFIGVAGGVGSSTLAANTAYALATQGKTPMSIAYLDFDWSFGNGTSLISSAQREAYSIPAPHPDCADLLIWAPHRLEPTQEVMAQIVELSSTHDAVILDLPRNASSTVMSVLEASKTVFCVTTIQAYAVSRLPDFSIIEDLQDESTRLILNRTPKKFTSEEAIALLPANAKMLEESLSIIVDARHFPSNSALDHSPWVVAADLATQINTNLMALCRTIEQSINADKADQPGA